MTGDLRSVDDHLAAVLGDLRPLAPLRLPLGEAHGCVLAEDVSAPAPLPGFDNSAMDGYAVRAADVAGASRGTPVTLPVVGDVAAGPMGALRVQPGLAVRIMTGAALPPGAEVIVPVEWTDGGQSQVTVFQAPEPGVYVRRAGEDLAQGARLLAAGTHLGAAQVGLLAAAGQAQVLVYPRPRVVVLSTGDELRDLSDPLGPGLLHDSNSYALAAAAREAGAQVYRLGSVPDDPDVLRTTLHDHLIRADLMITSGGVSVGAYDVVKEVLSREGSVEFVRVAMQPGMPQGHGVLGPDRVPIFCLPGNPVSALISFEVFVRPALRRMLAVEPLLRPELTATMATDWNSPEGKRQFVRGVVRRQEGGGALFTPLGGPGSHLLAALASANALAVVTEGVTRVDAGSPVTCMLLERRSR